MNGTLMRGLGQADRRRPKKDVGRPMQAARAGIRLGHFPSFTRALATHLISRGIRANVVVPGPIWTPLNPSDKAPKDVRKFGRRGDQRWVAPVDSVHAFDGDVGVSGSGQLMSRGLELCVDLVVVLSWRAASKCTSARICLIPFGLHGLHRH
jgi:NAD(P)-dependent dehydrogenase (short-subunit alcohol dehydrogenase family)